MKFKRNISMALIRLRTFLVAIRWPSIQPVCAVFDIYSRNHGFCFGD
jgi:hypothetical protein